MLRVRLQPIVKPTDSKISKSFRIVATDARRKRDTKSCKILGFYCIYNSGKRTLTIQKNHLIQILFEGGQPTKSVSRLLEPLLLKELK